MAVNAKQEAMLHYPGLPQEVSPEQAARLLEEYPQAADIINERLHEYRWAHDPDYAPEPAAEQPEDTTDDAEEPETKEEISKPMEGKPKR